MYRTTDEAHAELGTLISHDYYTREFGFCQPEPGPPRPQPEALGSILTGDRLFDSPYDIRMQENKTCSILCLTTLSGDDAKFVNQRIREGLAVNLLMDGLPAAEPRYRNEVEDSIYLSPGFALGTYSPPSVTVEGQTEQQELVAVNNHYDIHIEYHQRTPELSRVISVSVYPSSHLNRDGRDCLSETPLELSINDGNTFAFTYSVHWRSSPVKWATRWDNYLQILNPSIHWLSLVNSIAVA